MGVELLASGLNNLLSGGGAKAVSDAATPLVVNAVSQAAEDKLGNLAAIGITRGENGNFIIGQKAMMDPQKTLDSLGSLGLFDDYPKAKDKLGTLLGAGDYRMSHRPLMSGVTADDLTKAGIEGMSLPKDVYSHPQYYTFMYDESPDVMNEVMSVYNRAKGNPNAMVNAFRAVPAEADGQLNVGDWITLSPTYAQKHLESQFGGIGKIIQQRVPASSVHASMDDLAESGYYPASLEIDDKEIAPALRQYIDPDPTYSSVDLSNINNKPSPVSAIPSQSTGLSPAQQYLQGKDLNNDGILNQVAVQRDMNGDGLITPEEAFTMATGTQDTLNKNLRAISEKLGFPEYQDVRQKSLASIKNKIERKGGDYTAMSMKDHSRSKIMMNSWNDVPKTIEALQQAYPNAKMSIENVRNDWGYSGLHITFREPNGIGVEVQLTTADHWPVKLESDAIYDNWRTIASKDPSTLEPIVQKRLYAAIKKSQALWKAANVPDLSKYANV